MANKEYYKQCKMKKDNYIYVAWIPEKFAVSGKTINLKKDDGEWDEGWYIEDVNGKMLYSDLNTQSQEYKKHRDVTDI